MCTLVNSRDMEEVPVEFIFVPSNLQVNEGDTVICCRM